MSEYQYYEFQLLSGQLDPQAQEKMHSLSSRVKLSATSASFEYHYTGFPAQPQSILAQHFDMMLYMTNWGSRQVMFRFPLGTISPDAIQPYLYRYRLELEIVNGYQILNIEKHPEDNYGEWVEGEGWLAPMLPLHRDITRGDWRGIYLGWLGVMAEETAYLYQRESSVNSIPAVSDFDDWDDDFDPRETDKKLLEKLEPLVPPNLKTATRALSQLVNFFEINPDLLAAAQQSSATVEQNAFDFATALKQLTLAEKDDFLQRLLANETNLDITLYNRLKSLGQSDTSEPELAPRRTVHELLKLADELEAARLAEEKHQAEIAHRAKMELVAQKREQSWEQVWYLIAEKKTKAYEQAIEILKDLRDLADLEGEEEVFVDKMHEIKARYPTLRGLHNRMYKANLM